MAVTGEASLGLAYRHIRFTAGERPLNGLFHSSSAPGRGTRAAVHVHGLEGKFLGSNDFVEPYIATLGRAGIGTLLAERGGTGEKYWIGGQKLGASQETLESAVEDTRAAIEALKALGYQGIILSGFSLGATIAAATAAKHPEGINGVVLLSPTHMPDWLAAHDDRHAETLAEAERQLANGHPEAIVIPNHRGYNSGFSAAAYHSLANAALGPTLRELSNHGIPTLAVYGGNDEAITSSYGSADAFEEYVSTHTSFGAKVHQISGAGHDFAGFEGQLNKIVHDFVQA